VVFMRDDGTGDYFIMHIVSSCPSTKFYDISTHYGIYMHYEHVFWLAGGSLVPPAAMQYEIFGRVCIMSLCIMR